jgi:iron-sulfur cluster repair protein YtfE (RIC family)
MTDTERIVTADEPGKINFTEMYVTHDGFRRDLERFAAAAAAGKADSPQVRDGWQNFKRQLLVHHTVEDASLWPPLVAKVKSNPDNAEDLKLLEAMEAEHAALDPQLESVDKAMQTNEPDLPERVEELRAVLEKHLTHEETEALPLIQRELTQKDWKKFRSGMARAQKLNGAAVWIPWITDGMSDEDARKFLARMPPPLRLLYKISWESRYRNRRMWTF